MIDKISKISSGCFEYKMFFFFVRFLTILNNILIKFVN